MVHEFQEQVLYFYQYLLFFELQDNVFVYIPIYCFLILVWLSLEGTYPNYQNFYSTRDKQNLVFLMKVLN